MVFTVVVGWIRVCAVVKRPENHNYFRRFQTGFVQDRQGDGTRPLIICPTTAAEPPRPEEPSRRPETFGELFLKSRLAPDRCSRVTCVMQRPSFPNNGGCVGRRVWREAGTDGEGEERGSERSSRQLPPAPPNPHPSRNWPPSSSAERDWPQRGGAEGGGSVHDALFLSNFLHFFPSGRTASGAGAAACVRATPVNILPHADVVEPSCRKKSERERERHLFRRSVCD